MRTLRLGVAGLGFGAAVHVPAFRALPDVEVVAIAGTTRARAQAVADRLGIAQACEGMAELMQQDLDVVTLALPPAANGLALNLALDRGLDVLVEKPVAADADTAARLASRAHGRITATDFIFGELMTFQALRRLVADGALGEIQDVVLDWQVHSYAHKNRIWSWKMDAARGGGVMTALGAHALYLVEWLFGPARLSAARLDNGITAAFAPAGAVAAPDTAELDLTLSQGAAARLAMTNAQGGPVHRWTVRGSRATAILENTGADYVADFVLMLDGKQVARENFTGGDSRLKAFAPLACRFVEAVRSRMVFVPGLDAGARVQALMAEVEASL